MPSRLRRLFDFLDVFQASDTLANRGEICQRATEPALVHIKLSAGDGRLFHRFLRLLFAADKKNFPATSRYFLQKFRCAMQLAHRLIKINDVDLIALLENEWLHFRVPPLRLMAKVDTSFKQFRH